MINICERSGKEKMKYLTVNAFAKICGVTKHTLYHYEDVGLFKPVHVSDNGYRYYSYQQYDQIRFILMLRELGVSIDQIKVYINQSDYDIEAFLNENIIKIEEEIQKLQRMKFNIHQLLDRFSEMESVTPGVIFKTWMPKMKIMGSAASKKAKNYEQGLQVYAQYCAEHQVEGSRMIGERMPLDNIRKGHYFEYDYVFIDAKDSQHYNDVVEEGYYLCMYYKGNYDKCYEAYIQMMDYAGRNDLKIGTYGYEIYVSNNILVQEDDAQIIKVFAPLV